MPHLRELFDASLDQPRAVILRRAGGIAADAACEALVSIPAVIPVGGTCGSGRGVGVGRDMRQQPGKHVQSALLLILIRHPRATSDFAKLNYASPHCGLVDAFRLH